MYSLRKKNTRKCNTGTKSCAPGDLKFKERLDSKYNIGIGTLRVRLQLANFVTQKPSASQCKSRRGFCSWPQPAEGFGRISHLVLVFSRHIHESGMEPSSAVPESC